MATEERLITDLVSRISQQGAKTQEELAEDLLREINETALCEVSAYKVHVAAQGICNVIEKYMKASSTTEDQAVNNAHCLVYLLRLLIREQRGQINHLEGIDEGEKIRLKQTEEGILPPSLEDGVAVSMFRDVMALLTRQHPHLHADIHKHAAEVLFQLSASNYDTIIGSINMIFTNVTGGSEEETIAQLSLVEHINFNTKRLSELLDKVNRSTAHFKKAGVQFAVARVLRKAIWNWIDHYPTEFVQLCQKGVRLPGNPDALFDTFDGWAGSSNSKRKEFWPCMTMLLILCPDIMLDTIQGGGDSANKSKSKFLENLKKSLKSNKLADVSAICYVDIFKASTFASKQDRSALRHIVPAIETELKERLFNPNSPFKRSDGTVDEDLMVNCLVSAFMLSARKVINSLFADCLSKSTPKLFKFVLVRCLLIIADGGANLPWHPSISDIYSAHSSNLRALFQECINSLTKYAELLPMADKDKKSRTVLDSLKMDVDILHALLTLYCKDPLLALWPLKTPTQDIEDIRKFMVGLVTCSTCLPLTHAVSVEASNALLELHKPENLVRWCPRSVMDGFWTISSAVNIAFSDVLIHQKDLPMVTIQMYTSNLLQILKYRNEFLQTANLSEKPLPEIEALRSESSTRLEIALLVHLCSGKPEIGSACASSFALLCNEVDLQGESDDGAESGIAANYTAYKTLSTTAVLSTGRQAQQKAMRSTLRKVERQTAGNLAAWKEVYERFQQYTLVVTADSSAMVTTKGRAAPKVPQYLAEKSTTAVFLEWNNCLGFLTALCGVTVGHETTKQVAGPKGKVVEQTVGLLDSFLEMLLSLLISDLVNVRESVKLCLGAAISTQAYPTLFAKLHDEARKFFGTAGQVNFSNDATLYFDQAISILKLIFDQDIGGQDFSLLSDIDVLITTLLKFVRQLQPSIGTLQTRHKLCSLLESVMAKRGQISFRNEYEFRTDMVNNIMEWSSEFSGTADTEDKQAVKLTKELDLQVMKTISSLLRGLPLQGEDDQTKSAAFSKLFTFFTRLLTRCKKDPSSVLTPQLPEATITCVSFLVTANIEHGLEYFVTMGYHEDHDTRSAFLRVLCNILNQGTEFDTGDDGGDKYYKLLDLMMEGDMGLVLTLGDVIPITEADKVAQLLVRIFEANDKTLDLVKQAIDAEVSRTETANTLFRRNSMVTKMLAAYCKLCGREYLREALGPQVRAVIQNSSRGYELDEPKIPQTQTLQQNLENVTEVCELFVQDIVKSVPRCPRPFREVSEYLKKSVGEKFPGNEYTAIAGFMFLRFLGPAIVAPDGYGVINAPITDKDCRRAFVIITKVVQNLANRVPFTKEPFMAVMNGFVEKHMGTIQQIFDDYSTVPADAPAVPPISFTDEQKDEDLGQLHFLLSTHLEKMTRAVNAREDAKLSENLGRLTNILAQLGAPPEPRKTGAVSFARASVNAGANVAFEKFMKRMDSKNTDQIKDLGIFVEKGRMPDKKTPVFYYIARKFASNLDAELLIFYMLKQVQPYIEKSWALVVDLSLFGQEHEVPYAWCHQLYKVIPAVAGQSLEGVYVLNPNQWVKKVSKRLSKLTTRVNKKMQFFTSVTALQECVPDADRNLPSSTMSIEKNIQATYTPVTRYTKYGKKQCTVNIGTDMLHLISTQAQPLFNQNAQIVDLIHISRITDVSRKGNDEQECVITYEWNGSKTLELRSASAGGLIQQLTASKDRYNLSRPQNTLSGSRAFSPSDVPGTLLNMGLLNITATNPSLRSAAYNLLVSLCTTFGYGLRNVLLECNDVTIPRNARHFVVKISKELAITEPKLTLEFLLESLHGITKTNNLGQHLVLDYIKPWLPNLVFFSSLTAEPDSKEKVAKSKEVLNSLVALTIREANDMGPAIMNRVWKPIGKLPEMGEILLGCMVERAIPATSKTSPIGTKNMMTVEDIMVCLAAESPHFYSGKLIHRTLRMLEATQENPVENLQEHDLWTQIEIHIRWMMMLSFDNLLTVESYLPELLHIITMTFYSGTLLFRATVHRLFINVVHSLHTHGITDASKNQQLRFHLAEFQQLPFRLHFGVSGQHAGPFAKPQKDKVLDKMPISMVESVVESLMAALSCCYASPTAIGQARHARWLALTMRQAFTPNPALQPRAMCALGRLCRSSELVTDEFVTMLLDLLKESLIADINTSAGELSQSIIICLANLFEHLPPHSKFFRRFIWIVLSLIQIHDVKIFLPSVNLFEAVLRALDENEELRGYGLSAYCMEAREGSLAPLLAKLDQVSGCSFKQQFSFAVAGHLLKGFRNANTKTPTTRLLSTLLDVCRENVGANLLGYCVALLPYKGEDVHQRLNAAYVDAVVSELAHNLTLHRLESAAEGPHQVLFNSQMVPDKMNAALLFTFLATILKGSEFEHEQQFIFQTFQEGINFMPDAFAITFETLVPKLTHTLLNSQSATVLTAVLSIMRSIFYYGLDNPTTGQKLTAAYLPTIGFAGLAQSDTFQESSAGKQTVIKIVCSVIDALQQQ